MIIKEVTMSGRLFVPLITMLVVASGSAGAAERPAAPDGEGVSTMSSNTRSTARTSSSVTATSRATGADCAADATASITRNGETITVRKAQRAQTPGAGCNAAAQARTRTGTDDAGAE